MLLPRSGLKASYHDLTLLVVREFDSWKTMVYGPGVTIHGAPQFAEDKAKQQAVAIANDYLEHERHETIDGAPAEWQATAHSDWMVWKSQ